MEKFFGYLELAISCKSQDFEIVMSDFDANVVDSKYITEVTGSFSLGDPK